MRDQLVGQRFPGELHRSMKFVHEQAVRGFFHSSAMSIETNKRYIKPVHIYDGTSALVPDPMNTLCAR